MKKVLITILTVVFVLYCTSCTSVRFENSSENASSETVSEKTKSSRKVSSQKTSAQYLEYKNYECRVKLLDKWNKESVSEIMMAYNPDFPKKIDMYSLMHLDEFDSVTISELESNDLMEFFIKYYTQLFWNEFFEIVVDDYEKGDLTEVNGSIKKTSVGEYKCLSFYGQNKYKKKKCYVNSAFIMSKPPVMVLYVSEENSKQEFDDIVRSFEFYD